MPKPKWKREEVEFVLNDKQWLSETKEGNLNANGVQFVLIDDTRVNWWPNGTVTVQGKPSDIYTEADTIFSSPSSSYIPVPKSKVLVVYGHDKEVRDRIESIIKELGLEPIILDRIPGVGKTIIEQLEKQMSEAIFACVLLTPDDEGYKVGEEADKKYRARQNVIFELGMAVGKLGRENVAVFYKSNTEIISDIHGLIYIPFGDDDQGYAKKMLKEHLEQIGIETRAQ